MRKIVSLLVVLLLTCSVAWSQSRTISGTVKDQDGNIVPFATVNVKGSKVSTAVSSTGTFKIAVKTGDVLVLSAINYQTTEFTVGNDDNVGISMTKTGSSLSDVIVTTALGVQRQARSLGYATTKITGAELTQAKVTNAATGLAGKVAGLQISLVNNGVKPSVRANFRGNRSFLGNNQALLVVDGNLLDINFLGSINPNDIESTQTLNGASASALYGSAGSNGVIIVTTKKGAKGKVQVTVSSTVQLQSVAYLPELQNQFGAGSLEDGRLYPGLVYFPENPFQPYVPYENQSYGPKFNGQKVPLGPPIRIYNPDGSFYIKQDSTTYSAIPGAKLDFFDKGLTVQNDVSLQSGDDKSRFFMSFQDVAVTGVVPKDKDHRNTLRINGSRELGKFRADYNVGYTISKTNTTQGSYSGNTPVYWSVINQPASVDLRNYQDWQTNPFASPDGFYTAYYGNPWWQIDQARFDERTSTLIGSAALNYKPFDWLNFSYRLGVTSDNYNTKFTKAGYDFAPWAEADTLSAGNIASGVKNLQPRESDGFRNIQRVNSDFLITLTKTFFNKFDATLLLGNQVTSNYSRSLNVSASALLLSDFYNISNRIGEPNVSEVKAQSRTIGNFADLTLGFDRLIYAHASIRNDRVSVLPEQNRSFWYPSGDIAFVFTELWGDKKPSWLSFGKLRGAVSRVGQVNVSAYSTQNVFPTGGGFPYGGVTAFTVGDQFNNPNLKPEFSDEKEIGLELSFLKDRINFQTAVYKTNTTNQTVPAAISSATGYSSNVVNSGEMLNKGIEVTLNAVIVKNSKLQWSVGGNFAYNYNKVLYITNDLTQAQIGTDSYVVTGSAYPQIQTTDWLRDDQGRIIVDNQTGFPTIDPNPKNFGTANPPTRIGLNTNLQWKGFTLSAVADGRFGAVIYNDVASNLDFTGISNYSTQSGRESFVIPNSSYNVGTADKPEYVANTNITTQDGNVNFWAFTWNNVGSNYVTSADFWKLREVALSYDIPKSILSKSNFVKAASIGIVGRNLVIIKSAENVWSDPEFSNTSGNGLGTTDILQTPPTRFFGASVTITF